MHGVRALLTPAAFEGVVATVIDNNPGMEERTAERIVTEALKFVEAAARFPNDNITPSNVVDEGWHALILHTHLYKTSARVWAGSFTTGPNALIPDVTTGTCSPTR
ncbi:hypothetical protein [Streptomyces harbinensis]|uniref:hypothetical protein n=1 Tax=Streptomyces harbinensis TaxID=1176198 RepID=UPI001FE3461F|nr:hypothetical protein [Streptomyces harbinensis]